MLVYAALTFELINKAVAALLGVIEWVAHNIFMRVGDNPYVIVLMVLWVSL
jgi:hypothetical protein